MKIQVRRLVPLAFVAEVQRSIAFYEHLGFTVGNTFTPQDDTDASWASLESGAAQLMVGKATEPVIAEKQAVLFYLYTEDVAASRDALLSAGLRPGPITTPFYAPRGEFRLTDPDGYVLMVTHV